MLLHQQPKTNLEQRMQAMSLEREIALQKLLWQAFINKYTPVKISSLERTDMETLAWKMIKHQNKTAETTAQAFITANDQELIKIASHMFVASQCVPGLEHALASDNYLEIFHADAIIAQAYLLNNPYIIRYHIFALHHRMDACILNPAPSDAQKAELNAIVSELQAIFKKIKTIHEHEQFYYHLMALITYILAIPTLQQNCSLHDEQRGITCLKEALINLGISQNFAANHAKDSFLVTFGAGMFADLPLKSYEEFKTHLLSRNFLSNEELLAADAEITRRYAELTKT